MADKDKKPSKKDPSSDKSIKVSENLNEFDIQINSLGEIISNYDIDKINDFLNKNVEDKKLVNREDNLLDKLRQEKKPKAESDNSEENKD